MDTLKLVIIGATFAVGIVLVLIAVVALLRNAGAAASGTFSMGGLKLEGKGAPTVFLLVGAGMILSGFGWATAEGERKDAVRAVVTLSDAYEQQARTSRLLAERAPAAAAQLPPDAKATLRRPRPELNAKLSAEVSRLGTRPSQ